MTDIPDEVLDQVEAALAHDDRVREYIGTCGDGGCLVIKPVGMHTNGGCKCWMDRMTAQRLMLSAMNIRKALADLRKAREPMTGAPD